MRGTGSRVTLPATPRKVLVTKQKFSESTLNAYYRAYDLFIMMFGYCLLDLVEVE